MAGKKHMRKLDFQMGSHETPLYFKYLAISMDNNNNQLYGNLQPSACLLRATIAISRPSEHWCMFDIPKKAAPVKADLSTCGSGTMVFCYKAID